MSLETDKQGPQPRLLTGALVFYCLLVIAAWIWLGFRERREFVIAMALGDHGPIVGAMTGLAAGILMTMLLTVTAKWSPRIRSCEGRIREMLGQLDDHQVLMLSLISAVAEELFFRAAVQDAVGVPITVAIYVLLNSGRGMLCWLPVSAVSAAIFGGLVWSGAGLLAATTAHAIVNYLTLRRILSP